MDGGTAEWATYRLSRLGFEPGPAESFLGFPTTTPRRLLMVQGREMKNEEKRRKSDGEAKMSEGRDGRREAGGDRAWKGKCREGESRGDEKTEMK